MRAVSHGASKCLDHESYWSEPYTFVRLADARVHVRWGIVQDRPGRFLDESVHATRWLNQNVSELPHLPTVGGGLLPGMTLSGRCATREPRTDCRTRISCSATGARTTTGTSSWTACRACSSFATSCAPDSSRCSQGRCSIGSAGCSRGSTSRSERDPRARRGSRRRRRRDLPPLADVRVHRESGAASHRELFRALGGEASADAGAHLREPREPHRQPGDGERDAARRGACRARLHDGRSGRAVRRPAGRHVLTRQDRRGRARRGPHQHRLRASRLRGRRDPSPTRSPKPGSHT